MQEEGENLWLLSQFIQNKNLLYQSIFLILLSFPISLFMFYILKFINGAVLWISIIFLNF